MISQQRGFQIIEAVILLSIVVILASVALPAYQSYDLRAQISAGLKDMSVVQQAVEEQYSRAGRWPDSRRAAGLPAAPGSTQSRFVSAVQVGKGGVVVLLFGNHAAEELQGRSLQLTPYLDQQGGVSWRCGHADAPSGRSRAPHATGTLDRALLPTVCRPATASP